MNKIYNLLFAMISVTLFSSSTNGQNLVPNPSFEQYDTCPDGLGRVKWCADWNAVRQSPDYYNTCAPNIGASASVPSNWFGYQYPSSGNAYMGFCARLFDELNYREYIGSQLITPLQIGTRYYVSLKVSLSTPSHATQYCAVNKLGAHFSTVRYSVANGDTAPIFNYAQVYTDSIITDTLNWTTIKGSFIPDSNYTYINIGSFFSDSLTNFIQLAGNEDIAYYYLDDICVSEDSAYAYNYPYDGINDFSKADPIVLYPNPTRDFIVIENAKADIELYILYDLTGRLLKAETSNNSSYHTLNLNYFVPGTYNLIIQRKNFICSSHLIIKL